MTYDPVESLLFQVAASKQARIEVLSRLLRGMARRAVVNRQHWNDAVILGRAAHARAKGRADRAEAELLRVRPVVDAAITFVEEWDDGFHDNAELLEYLSAVVKEAQRDG